MLHCPLQTINWVHKWAEDKKYRDFEWHHVEDLETMQPCDDCTDLLKQLPKTEIEFSFDFFTEKQDWKNKVDEFYKYIISTDDRP